MSRQGRCAAPDAREAEQQSRSAAAPLSKKSDSGAPRLGDHRPETAAQLQLQKMSNGSSQARQLKTSGQMMQDSPRTTQLKTMQGVTASSPVIQRRQVDRLTAGGFNMIGETHTDFPNENARKYESRKVREVLGGGAKYFTESMLKTDSANTDYSDPVDLRLEQVIAFVKDNCAGLLPDLKKFNGVSFDQERQRDLNLGQNIAPIVQRLMPMITNGEESDQIMGFIRTQHYAVGILRKLESLDNWDGFDPEEQRDTFNTLLDAIALEADNREDAGPEDGAVVEAPSRLAEAEVIPVNITTLYDEYKGRLPRTLELYYQIKNQGEYADKAHFRFFSGAVGPTLAAWTDIERLSGEISVAIRGNQVREHLEDYIARGYAQVSALTRVLDMGMLAGAQNRSAPDVRKERSKAMHRAATVHKDENIAWKVGDLHIKDIKELEASHEIATEYVYIEKEQYKANNPLPADEMASYQEREGDVDRTYGEAKTGEDLLREGARAGLAESPAKAHNDRLFDIVARASGMGEWVLGTLKRSALYLALRDAETNQGVGWGGESTKAKLTLLDSFLRVLHLVYRAGHTPEQLLDDANEGARRKLELDSDFTRSRSRFNSLLLEKDPAGFIRQAPDLGDTMKRAFTRILVEVASESSSHSSHDMLGGSLGLFM